MRPIALPDRVAGEISRLRAGTVHLSVPLDDDIIQVGAARAGATGTIEVVRTSSTLTVRRTGGSSLQAQIVHLGQDGRDGAVERATVFPEPVDALRIWRTRHPGGDDRWIVGHDDRLARPSDLVQLVETIIGFSVAKQRPHLPPASRRKSPRHAVRAGTFTSARGKDRPPTPAGGGPTPGRRPPG